MIMVGQRYFAKLSIVSLFMALNPMMIASQKAPSEDIDTLGAANFLGQEQVLKSAGLVRQGKVQSLAIETGPSTPAYGSREYSIEITKTEQIIGKNEVTFLDDRICSHNGIGTQIDGFGHAGVNSVHYNGISLGDIYQPNGITKLSTSKIPPMVTRGILLDMAAYFGKTMLTEGVSYNTADIKGALAKQNISLGKGDVVIFHSGWGQLLGKDDSRWLDAHPGLGEEGAKYLASQGVVAVGADTAALEVIPFEDKDKLFPVHQILLVEEGVYILEGLNTSKLADEGIHEFMFVLGIPKLAGSVQAIVNPVAIY